MSKSLQGARECAFLLQDGRCFYCSQQMWTSDPRHFAAQHHLTIKQTKRYRCTAEHLRPRRDGGGHIASNIVAACWFCNSRRHMRKADLSPSQFKAHVQKRLKRGLWHPAQH